MVFTVVTPPPPPTRRQKKTHTTCGFKRTVTRQEYVRRRPHLHGDKVLRMPVEGRRLGRNENLPLRQADHHGRPVAGDDDVVRIGLVQDRQTPRAVAPEGGSSERPRDQSAAVPRGPCTARTWLASRTLKFSPVQRAQCVSLLCVASAKLHVCLLYTSPSPRDATLSRMPPSA